MQKNHSFDVDWSKTENINSAFNYKSYGFSSYLIFSKCLMSLFDFEITIANLRYLNFIYFYASSLFLFLSFYLLFPVLISFLGSFLFIILPGVFFDCWMARPESFLTMLSVFVLFLYILFLKNKKFLYLYLSLFIIGYGVATKITFIFLLFPFLLSYPYKANHLKILPLIIVFFLGLFLGAPALVYDFSGFISGLIHEKQHYATGHPPHSLHPTDNKHVLGTFFLQTRFYLFCYGAIFISPFLYFFKKNMHHGLATAYVVAFAYLSSQAVFFERNFHFFLPIGLFFFCCFLANYRNKKSQVFLIVVFALPLIFCTAKIFVHGGLKKKNEEIIKVGLETLRFDAILNNKIPKCGKFKVIDYCDSFSGRYRKKMRQNGFETVKVTNGDFSYLPVSTLQTYLDPNWYYFEKSCTISSLKAVDLDFGIMHNSEFIGIQWAKDSSIQSNQWTGNDFSNSKINGFHVFGSYINGDCDKGYIALNLQKGDSILFRTGPVPKRQRIIFNQSIQYLLPRSVSWSILTFNSDKLPEYFNVKFYDTGDRWGEWSAVALKPKTNN
jgi:hypothetical protein